MAKQQWQSEPEMMLDKEKKYTATFRTEKGDIVVHLFAKETPHAVNSFVFLARQGFYNGTIFHRVITDFMAQGGDPTGTGRGGPGYQFKDEISPLLRHEKPGTLSMANAGLNTNGSQFFITHVPTPWLDGKHTVFGEVTSGMDILMSIPARDPMLVQSKAVKLITVEITEE